MFENIKYFDIHSHLHSDFFKEDANEIIKEMKNQKIWSITVGVDFNDSKKAVKLAKENENIFATIGIHPTEKGNFNKTEFQNLLNENKDVVIGIGECGLDYYWPNRDLNQNKITEGEFKNKLLRQRGLFISQIDFSLKNNLPMMLHIRSYKNSDAYIDTFKILKKYKDTNLKVNFHFFTEDEKIVKKILKLNKNFMCSLPGVITFADLNDSIEELPLENIMSETDSPFATPVPYRGKQNNPLYVKEIVKKISEVKKIDLEDVKIKLIKNTLNFWNIKL